LIIQKPILHLPELIKIRTAKYVIWLKNLIQTASKNFQVCQQAVQDVMRINITNNSIKKESPVALIAIIQITGKLQDSIITKLLSNLTESI
jgi:spore coat protein CotF